MRNDYIQKYLEYNEPTEVPKSFHRWCALSSLSVLLGRNFYFNLGHYTIYPNMYVMLVGSPGTRKSSSIKVAKKLVGYTGFDKFSAERTTKEKFLLDLQGEPDSLEESDTILDRNIFGDACGIAELYIAADEFNDFIGNGNMEFISLLGSLWDFSGVYTNRIKNGKSVAISNPTINILGGNTPTGFSLAFPVDILGQGFFSRLILVYGEPTGKRITFPPAPDIAATEGLLEELARIKNACQGEANVDTAARSLLDKIYREWKPLQDVRFDSYSNRRFTHLLKLCLLCAASRASSTVTEEDVMYANTILTHTEHLMPRALGEFGSSKNAAVASKIIAIVEKSGIVYNASELIQHLYTDIDNPRLISELVNSLVAAKKLQVYKGGLLPVRTVIEEKDSLYVNFSFLTEEERSYSK